MMRQLLRFTVCAAVVGCGSFLIPTTSKSSAQTTMVHQKSYSFTVKADGVSTICGFLVSEPEEHVGVYINYITAEITWYCDPPIFRISLNSALWHEWPCELRPNLCSNTWAIDRDSISNTWIYASAGSRILTHGCTGHNDWVYVAAGYPEAQLINGDIVNLAHIDGYENILSC